MASPFDFNRKDLERKLRDGMNSILIDKTEKQIQDGMEGLLDKIYQTITTPRHKARGKEKVGRFSQYGVPVDTGKLKSSIKKLPIIKSQGHIIGRIIQDASIAPYGAFIEYGHGIKKGGHYVGWVPPQSFMRSALYKHQADIKKLLKG